MELSDIIISRRSIRKFRQGIFQQILSDGFWMPHGSLLRDQIFNHHALLLRNHRLPKRLLASVRHTNSLSKPQLFLFAVPI